MIHVDNLTKYYGSKVAIQNVTFQVDRGEIFGVLGPKGAGKTTTMRILTAYLPPSEGTATVAGFDVFSHSLEVRKRVGYLPESVSLYPDMTVCGYLDFVAELRKIDNRAEQVQETLDRINLEDQADTLIGKLSRGMRRRVGIAQAIIHNPDVLILDEPTNGLEPAQIIEMRELIKSLGQKHTIILSTRVLPEVEQICERALILYKGRIAAEDTPARLVARLEGAHTIRLQISSVPPGAVNTLQALEGVKRVEIIDSGTLAIECGCDVDCRPAVANLVVQNGWELLELQIASASLEDIFLEINANPEVTV